MIDYYSGVRIVLKLVGVGLTVYAAVTATTYLPVVVNSGAEYDTIHWYIIPILGPLLFGLLLWWFPAAVTNTIVAKGPVPGSETADWARELERIAISLLGLYLLYNASTRIIYEVMTNRAREELFDVIRPPPDYSATITSLIIQVLLAILLILGSAGIVEGLRKLRYAGLR